MPEARGNGQALLEGTPGKVRFFEQELRPTEMMQRDGLAELIPLRRGDGQALGEALERPRHVLTQEGNPSEADQGHALLPAIS
jgi:hypothetical protein